LSGRSGEHEDTDTEPQLGLVLKRLKRQLTEQERAMVRARIKRQRTILRQIRAVPLDNGDEPAPGFDPSPWAGPEAVS
jgi:hypothetical protein